jgi:hypothetical protein
MSTGTITVTLPRGTADIDFEVCQADPNEMPDAVAITGAEIDGEPVELTDAEEDAAYAAIGRLISEKRREDATRRPGRRAG